MTDKQKESQRRAKKKYDELNTIQVKLKLNKKTDKDILEMLEHCGNKQGYIKKLIREDLQKRKKGV